MMEESHQVGTRRETTVLTTYTFIFFNALKHVEMLDFLCFDNLYNFGFDIV